MLLARPERRALLRLDAQVEAVEHRRGGDDLSRPAVADAGLVVERLRERDLARDRRVAEALAEGAAEVREGIASWLRRDPSQQLDSPCNLRDDVGAEPGLR